MRKSIALLVLLPLLAGCSASSGNAQPSPTATPSADYSSLPAELPGTGTYVAGVDMQPGTYEQSPASPSCEWFIGDDQGKLISSGTGETVVVEVGQTLESSNCTVWQLL